MSIGLTLSSIGLGASAILLLLAGTGKLRNPRPIERIIEAGGLSSRTGMGRVAGVTEMLVGAAGMTLGARLGAGLVAGTFVGLAVGTAMIRSRVDAHPCGCFGDADADPLGPRHVITNLLMVALAASAAVMDPLAPCEVVARRPARGLALLAGELLLALALRTWLQHGVAGVDAAATRLAESSSRMLGADMSRRSFLVKMAVGGSALAVAPLRFLLYPGTALAIVAPSDCRSGLCTDGYTAFCCEINQGLNSCPTGTFPGGWWMCTDYRGKQLCDGAGIRYYVDCNALPGREFPGGCRCANGSCDDRRVACNVFRYGQCNTHIKGTTAVVCRMVLCENPGSVPSVNCSSAVMVDNAVCGHEATCLEPPAVQLVGAGGA